MLLIDGLKGIWPWSWLFAPTSPRMSSAATRLQAPHTAGSSAPIRERTRRELLAEVQKHRSLARVAGAVTTGEYREDTSATSVYWRRALNSMTKRGAAAMARSIPTPTRPWRTSVPEWHFRGHCPAPRIQRLGDAHA